MRRGRSARLRTSCGMWVRGPSSWPPSISRNRAAAASLPRCPLVSREVTLINMLGLHARAAARLVQMANHFQSRITLSKDGRTVDAKSILGVLMLAGSLGERLLLSAEGVDAEDALEALAGLVRSRFGESC